MPDHILIDAREKHAPRAAWSRRLLGLPVLSRAIKAARRAGFSAVTVLTDPEADISDASGPGVAGADMITAAGIGNGLATPAIYMRADVLAETGWLGQAITAPIEAGIALPFGAGVAVCGEGATLDAMLDASAAATGGAGGPTMVLQAANDWPAAERRLLASLVKETDGFMARHFARPISLWLSRGLARTAMTPNAMTMISLMIGLAAAPFFLSSSPWFQIVGGLLFVAHSVIDGCDGELARLKFTESRFGGLLDFWSDNIVHVAVFACMGAGWMTAEAALWPIWIAIPAVAGTAGSAVTVYWLTLRGKRNDGPVYTSVASGPGDGLTKLLDELSRRDFIYLVFVLSLFGKAAWFLIPTAIGAPIFLGLVLVSAWRARPDR